MNRGEVATLVCGPGYAFGAKGAPPRIPPNATVETRIELVDWLDLAVAYNRVPGKMETDEELRVRWREELEEGTSPMRPEAGGVVFPPEVECRCACAVLCSCYYSRHCTVKRSFEEKGRVHCYLDKI